MLYDSTKDVGNRTLATDARDAIPEPMAYRFGITDEDHVSREEGEHTRFLYASLSRPLGMWFDLAADHSLLGGGRRWSVVGTSTPLGINVLNSYELTPVDLLTQAASMLRAEIQSEGAPQIAAFNGDRREGIDTARILTQIPEHDGAHSVVTFRAGVGPTGHMCYTDTNRFSMTAGSLLEAFRRIARMDEVVPVSIADAIVSDWAETATA